MTIALILAGHTYKIMPAAAGFAYQIDGRALSVGQTFEASIGAMSNDSLKLGMMRGHIVELFDELTVEERDARLTELRQAMGDYASAHSCFGFESRLIYNAAQTEELETDDDALFGLTVTQPYIKFTAVTVLAGTTLSDTAPAKFQAVQNGADKGARVAATGSTPFDISRSGMTGIAAGDVLGWYAVDDSDGSRLSNTVTKVAIYETPAITGTPTQGATSVTGTSTAPNGAVVTVYQNSTAIKTATVGGGAGAWTASGIGGSVITAGSSLTAVVAAGSLQTSASSTAVIVKFNAPVITDVGYSAADTVVAGTSDAPDGTTITVFKAGVTSLGTTTVASGAWTKTGLTLAGNDSLTAKAGLTTAQSAASAAVVVHFNAPVVTSPIAALGDVTGTSDAANGTLITVFKQSLGVGSFNAITPTGTVTSNAFDITPDVALAATDVVVAKAGTGANQSAASNSVTVTP